MDRRQFLTMAAVASLGASRARPSIADRAACSSLVQRMQPLETAAVKIAGLGYRLALVGSALMASGNVEARVAELVHAGRSRMACS